MATATLITSAEFLARPDEFDQSGNPIQEELIGGAIVQMPNTSKRHDITKSTVSGIRRKITAYLENGALSVWIFYDDGSIAVHNSSQVREVRGEQTLEDPFLPGFSVSASTFFTLA